MEGELEGLRTRKTPAMVALKDGSSVWDMTLRAYSNRYESGARFFGAHFFRVQMLLFQRCPSSHEPNELPQRKEEALETTL